ncbi:hypothetical protein BGZ96_009019 [Linnemannia gamsii]|uniref:No apical meristem-associated C-terminal domain-containing protein n=1 Tax=Linnemannia gamsii TaxID=64522 RepID=A0ABQ7JYA1_9FUNG|nr:hypothetical protein BGZ96_009019 [Linnemannia gamsii]
MRIEQLLLTSIYGSPPLTPQQQGTLHPRTVIPDPPPTGTAVSCSSLSPTITRKRHSDTSVLHPTVDKRPKGVYHDNNSSSGRKNIAAHNLLTNFVGSSNSNNGSSSSNNIDNIINNVATQQANHGENLDHGRAADIFSNSDDNADSGDDNAASEDAEDYDDEGDDDGESDDFLGIDDEGNIITPDNMYAVRTEADKRQYLDNSWWDKDDIKAFLRWFFNPNNAEKYKSPGKVKGCRLKDIKQEVANVVNKAMDELFDLCMETLGSTDFGSRKKEHLLPAIKRITPYFYEVYVIFKPNINGECTVPGRESGTRGKQTYTLNVPDLEPEQNNSSSADSSTKTAPKPHIMREMEKALSRFNAVVGVSGLHAIVVGDGANRQPGELDTLHIDRLALERERIALSKKKEDWSRNVDHQQRALDLQQMMVQQDRQDLASRVVCLREEQAEFAAKNKDREEMIRRVAYFEARMGMVPSCTHAAKE